MEQYDREQQAFLSRVIFSSIPFFAILVILLFVIVVVVFAYFQFMPLTWLRRLGIAAGANEEHDLLIMIEGVIVDHDPKLHRVIPPELTLSSPPRSPDMNIVQVEIVNANEPPFAHWIAEVENQLTSEGWLP